MMDDERDVERASLLSVDTLVEKPVPATPRRPTPLPKLQIAILLGIQLAEPISSQLILPFINQLVQELGVTGGDDKKLGYYAGIIESMFFVAEAACVFQWGRLSDRIGRRPLLLVGTMGQVLSALCFGMSRSYWAVIASRAFAGAMNGNIGVVKTVMGELTDETNIAQGFALMPAVWCLGGTLGPFLGGTLSHPHERYPEWFGSPFWRDYPYLLPCLISACYSLLIFGLALLFLRESRPPHRKLAGNDYHQLSDLPDTPSTPSTPEPPEPEPASLRSILRGPLLAVIVNYNLLAVTEIAFGVLQPLVFATSVASGGLGLTPKHIGIALAAYGIANGVTQARAFPPLLKRLGPKRTFMVGVIALTLIFTTFPVMQTFARITQSANVLVWVVIALQYVLAMAVSSAYGTVNIFMVSTASRAALGATNGVVQTTTSVMRAVGPTIATSLYALSVERNILGGWFAFLIFSLMGLCCVYASTWLPANVLKRDAEDEKDYD
ncbi:MFS general substrate transporter [Auricularia subglabra TFB-10046 SS5]|uniref:MFS general substrate transporter n=1 Tax=Auricularia subglabra (strain TFB-10046 / SS5) TaxID=717982 RepID=J0WWU0_AURST|nr:MFS general substrate transporter [Auricularia subglabra TFB-10046 SS5]